MIQIEGTTYCAVVLVFFIGISCKMGENNGQKAAELGSMGDIKENMTVADLAKVMMGQFKEQKQTFQAMNDSIQGQINDLNQRLNRVDRVPFDPNRTICISGFKPQPGVSDEKALNEIFQSVGGGCEIVNTKRMKPYGSKPGLLKCEFESAEEKISILQRKMAIRDFVPEIWLRSSKSYSERVIEDNFNLLLSLIPDGYKFKMASDGHIIVKAEFEEELQQEMEIENMPPTNRDMQQGNQAGSGASNVAPHSQTQGGATPHFKPGAWARGGYQGRQRGGYRGGRGYRGGNRGGGFRGGRGGYFRQRNGTPNAWNRSAAQPSTPQHALSQADYPSLSQSNSSTTPAVKRPRQFSPEVQTGGTNGVAPSGGPPPNAAPPSTEMTTNTSDPARSDGQSA